VTQPARAAPRGGRCTPATPIEADGGLTSAGQALRAQAEAETDKMAASPWQHLGDERAEEVAAIGKAMTRLVMSAGAFPADGVFPAR
jgi:hypothetical protein